MIDTEVLRKKIIELAIQGKLTEQLPSDENAESLYAQIQEEKEKRIKAGELKREKTMPSISESDTPFDIPGNWHWVYMGEIFDHNTGKALNTADKDGVKLEYITTSNMYWDHFELDGLKSMYFKESEIEKCTITKGDLLICEGGDIGRSAIWTFDYDMRIQNHIHKLRGYGGIEHKFYFYIMRNYKDSGMIDGRGIGLQGFSSKRVHSLIVPLPPLAEQKRIVEKLDTLLEQIDIIDTLQQQYEADLSVLKGKIIAAGIRGKLTEQFPEDGDAEDLYVQILNQKSQLIKEGKIKKEKPLPDIAEDEIPFEIPKNWKWVRLGTCINLLSGQDFKPEDYNDKAEGMPYMTGASNIVDGKLLVNRWTECPKNISHKGDLLLVCKGSGYGKIAFNDVGDVHIARQFMAISVDYDMDINYIAYILQWSIDRIRENGQGLIPGIDRPSVLSLLLPLPPYAEQTRISNKIDELLQILG